METYDSAGADRLFKLTKVDSLSAGPDIRHADPVPPDASNPSGPDVVPIRKTAMNGWVLPVSIHGLVTSALIDTGACTSVLSRSVYMALPPEARKPMNNNNVVIRGVGDTTVIPLGRMWVDLTIAGDTYPIEMIVSNADETAGIYLGMCGLYAKC